MLSNRRFRWVSTLAVALLVAACGGNGDDVAGDTTTTTAPTTTTAVEAGEAGEGAEITVLDPGAEPRSELRFELEAGDVSEALLTMTMGIAVEIDGEALPQTPVPPMQMRMRTEVVHVDPGTDRITARVSYSDVDIVDDGTVDSETAAQIRANLDLLNRVSGTMVVTSRGLPVESDFDLPDDLDPNSRQLMEQMTQQVEALTVPFPDEEVGEGATWRARTVSSVGGIETVLDLTYELQELDGTSYVLGVSYDQTAEPQEAEFPGAPPGTVSRVTEYLVDGDGGLRGDLTAMLPRTSTVTAGGDVVMTVEDDAESIEVRQRIDIEIRLEGDA
jgi:hypothetical protein